MHQMPLITVHPVFVLIFHSTARSFTHSLTRSLARLFPSTFSLSRVLPVEPSWALHLHIGAVSRSGESRTWFYRAAHGGERRERREREREREIRVYVNVKSGQVVERASRVYGMATFMNIKSLQPIIFFSPARS